jgi:hypothetical protein
MLNVVDYSVKKGNPWAERVLILMLSVYVFHTVCSYTRHL